MVLVVGASAAAGDGAAAWARGRPGGVLPVAACHPFVTVKKTLPGASTRSNKLKSVHWTHVLMMTMLHTPHSSGTVTTHATKRCILATRVAHHSAPTHSTGTDTGAPKVCLKLAPVHWAINSLSKL
jgi:hypothetical protein